MNMAGLWKLPFIAVIEDNDYAVSTTKKESTVVSAAERAPAYGCAGEWVPGNDPDLIFAAAGRAIERARRGEGPSILELQTERLHGHFIGDAAGYRSKAEVANQKDPIPRYRARLIEENLASEEWMQQVEAQVNAQVAEAIAFARQSDYPAPEEALEKVFA